MRAVDLPSPGLIGGGPDLRQDAAWAISCVQIVADKTPGRKTTAASDLRAFFIACANALKPLDPTPSDGTV